MTFSFPYILMVAEKFNALKIRFEGVTYSRKEFVDKVAHCGNIVTDEKEK